MISFLLGELLANMTVLLLNKCFIGSSMLEEALGFYLFYFAVADFLLLLNNYYILKLLSLIYSISIYIEREREIEAYNITIATKNYQTRKKAKLA
jgi:hypothetical protein